MPELPGPGRAAAARALPWLFALSFLSFMSESFIGSKIVIGSFLLVWWLDPPFIKTLWLDVRKPFLAMAAFLLVMALLSEHRLESFRAGLSVFKSWLVFFPAAWLVIRQGPVFARAWLFAMTTFTLLGGAAAVLTWKGILLPGMQDAEGEGINWYANRNSFAVTLGFAWAVGVAWLVSRDRRQLRADALIGVLCVLVLLTAVIFLNKSRGGLIAAVFASGVIIAARLPWRWSIGLGVPALGIATLSAWLGRDYLAAHFQRNSFLNKRDEVYGFAWDSIIQHPWLGRGPDTFKLDAYVKAHSSIGGYDMTHDIYLDILYSTGLAGLVFWLGFYGAMIAKARHAAPAFRPDQVMTEEARRFLMLAFLGFASYLVAHGVVDFGFYRQMPGVVFSACLGGYYALRSTRSSA